MNHPQPRDAAAISEQDGPTSKSVGFAEHSAATDIVSASFYRNQMMQQLQQPLHPATLQAHHASITSNMDSMYHGTGSSSTMLAETSGKPCKTVSFSQTNQTIEADNTIRASSVSLAIHPALAAREALAVLAEDTEFVEGSAMLLNPNTTATLRSKPSTALPFALPMPIDNALNEEFHTVQNQHIPSSARPGLNANLHIEMSCLALSASQASSSRMMSMSGRHSFLHASCGEDLQDITQIDDQQQELTEKAVLVIRRVRDKLTGLDVLEASATAAGGVQALAVPEQVERLIKEATSNENLSQSFFGWCPYW
jgi:hypothetical protein